MRISRFATGAVLVFAVLAGAATAQTPPKVVPAGEYYWYADEGMTEQIGYMIWECDGTIRGPYGNIGWEHYVPYDCD
jgi:hypothetical protein